jgi:hypothetical protein
MAAFSWHTASKDPLRVALADEMTRLKGADWVCAATWVAAKTKPRTKDMIYACIVNVLNYCYKEGCRVIGFRSL